MASGPDLTPFINALQHKSESASAGAARYMTAALHHVELIDNIRRAELKRQQEEEDEALLKGLALDTPMGKMDAYTLAKAGGGSAFEAVRSMVLTKSAMDREAANIKMIDALTLKLRNASNDVPVQAQLVEKMNAQLGNVTPVDPDAPAATPVDPDAPAAEKTGGNMTPLGPIKGLSAAEMVRKYTRGVPDNLVGPLAAGVESMLNFVGPRAPRGPIKEGEGLSADEIVRQYTRGVPDNLVGPLAAAVEYRLNPVGSPAPTPPRRPFRLDSPGEARGASHSPTNARALSLFLQ